MNRTSPLHALPRKDYFSVEMWFALDLGPKYFAKSDGLPPFVLLLLSKNDFMKPLGAMNWEKGDVWGVGWGGTSHFLSDSVF